VSDLRRACFADALTLIELLARCRPGAPVVSRDVAEALECHLRTAQRWLAVAEGFGYVTGRPAGPHPYYTRTALGTALPERDFGKGPSPGGVAPPEPGR
jgi:hypothetical protein